MIRCRTCGGWAPTVASCPNCDAGAAPAARTWLKSVGLAVGGAAVGMTLAACYGSPCAQYGADGECLPPSNPTSAKDCADRQAAGDPNLATDPACSEWYQNRRCADMSEAQNPNLTTDPDCADWLQQKRCEDLAAAGKPAAAIDPNCGAALPRGEAGDQP